MRIYVPSQAHLPAPVPILARNGSDVRRRRFADAARGALRNGQRSRHPTWRIDYRAGSLPILRTKPFRRISHQSRQATGESHRAGRCIEGDPAGSQAHGMVEYGFLAIRHKIGDPQFAEWVSDKLEGEFSAVSRQTICWSLRRASRARGNRWPSLSTTATTNYMFASVCQSSRT
jgi:hypothetical protein